MPAPDISLWLSISTDTINNARLWPTNAWRHCLPPSRHPPAAPPPCCALSVWWRVRLSGQITTCPFVYGTSQSHTCSALCRSTRDWLPTTLNILCSIGWLLQHLISRHKNTILCSAAGRAELLALQNKCGNKRSIRSCGSPCRSVMSYFKNKIALISKSGLFFFVFFPLRAAGLDFHMSSNCCSLHNTLWLSLSWPPVRPSVWRNWVTVYSSLLASCVGTRQQHMGQWATLLMPPSVLCKRECALWRSGDGVR